MRLVVCSAVVLLLAIIAPLAGEEAAAPSLNASCVPLLFSSSITPNSASALPRNPEPQFLDSGGECPPPNLNCFPYATSECRPCGANKVGYCDNYMCSDGLLHACCFCGFLIC